ncbi:MAG: hypothetical protein KBS41_02110 [Oscillospiraceae bacterium]|nr:hypothetical protein [Candidatus Equicaccousia limihippi]
MPYTDTEKIKILIQNRKLSHAVILEGEEETTLDIAVKTAAALFCEEDAYYCGKCKNCTTALARSHADILILEPKKVNYAVEDIRYLVTQAYLMPLVANGRTFIITKAEKLRADAQNTLLKVIEEPPAGVHFIFCTRDKTSLLPTVISRSTVFSFKEGEGGDNEIANKILSLADKKESFEILKILYGITTVPEYIELLNSVKMSAVKRAFGENAAKFIRIASFCDDAVERMKFYPPLRLLSAKLCSKLCE